MTPRAIAGRALNRLFADMVVEGMALRPESMPVRERVIDRLADLMICADEVLELVAKEPSGTLGACEKPVQRAYDSINSLMKSLCD